MCIQIVYSFAINDKKYTVVLNQRDCDISTKDLPFGSLNALLNKYKSPRAAKGLPSAPEDDVYGLFSDSQYAFGQMAIGDGRIALLSDFRLHAKDERCSSHGVMWTRKRGGSTEAYARHGVIATDYTETEYPHMMVFVDSDGLCDTYEFDGKVRATASKLAGTPDHPVASQTCGGSVQNFRLSRMTELAVEVTSAWDEATTPIAEFAESLVAHVLGDTAKPDDKACLLDLGKDPKYERHVESVRIEPAASWDDPTKPLSWMTVASVACVIDHAKNCAVVASRSFRKPKTGEEASECAAESPAIDTTVLKWPAAPVPVAVPDAVEQAAVAAPVAVEAPVEIVQ